MTFRKPYKSPFWSPEAERGPDYFRKPSVKSSPLPEAIDSIEQNVRAAASSRHVDRAGGYSANDILLFQQMMDFSRQSERGEPVPVKHEKPPLPPTALKQSATAKSTVSFSPSDAKLFAALQAQFSSSSSASTHQTHGTRPAQPKGEHGYSQRDLDGFEQLMKFDAR